MIYSLVTTAGIVISIFGPMSEKEVDQCDEKSRAIRSESVLLIEEKGLETWCDYFEIKPKLGDQLVPRKEIVMK